MPVPFPRHARSVVATAVLVLLLGASPGTADAAPGFVPDAAGSRLGGADRFETAALTALDAFPEGAQTVVLANGWRNVDALTGTYLAGLVDGPVLLTDRDVVPAATLDALHALGTREVVVLGDENSVGPRALDQLSGEGFVVGEVLAGEDRYDTAAQVYESGPDDGETVYLARGDFPAGQVAADALAAGPFAYQGRAVLLTAADALPDVVAEALLDGQPRSVVFLGRGISQDVRDEVRDLLPNSYQETVGGRDRTETAALLARSGTTYTMGATSNVALANGYTVDALGAGVWAGRRKAPLLLTAGTGALGIGTESYLRDWGSTMTSGTVFGSVASVPDALAVRARELAQGSAPELRPVTAVDVAAGHLALGRYSPVGDDRDTYWVVDGEHVPYARFLAAARVGDAVLVRSNTPRWEGATLTLVHRTPQDWTSGPVTPTASGFAVLDPETAVALRDVPANDLVPTATYTVDGVAATRADFLADLSTGDTVVLGPGAVPSSYALTNRSLEGQVLDVTADSVLLDTRGGRFRLPRPTAQTQVSVDGAQSTLSAFDRDLSVEDWIVESGTRQGRTTALRNTRPTEIYGDFHSGMLLTQAPGPGEPSSASLLVDLRHGGPPSVLEVPWDCDVQVNGQPSTAAAANTRLGYGVFVRLQRADAATGTRCGFAVS